MNNVADIVDKFLCDTLTNTNGLLELEPDITTAASMIISSLMRGGKVLVCGNGGSAADAQHFAAELVNRFRVQDRDPLPAIALTTDTSIITAIGNDSGYDNIFERQVNAYGVIGDVLLGISTSGTSENVVNALAAAKARGLLAIGLTGPRKDTKMYNSCTHCICVPGNDVPFIQHNHIIVLHAICDAVEKHLARIG